MAIFLIISLLLLLPSLKAVKQGELYTDYLSKETTASINGLFTLLVFLSHVSTYIKLDGAFDKPYTSFKSYMLQMVVVPFLFYSGYGIMESIKKKGISYVKATPKNRFLKVLIHFDIAVVIFLILNLVFGKTYSVKHILLALIGYSSVGNSNWYIFAVLGLYVIVYLSFMLIRKSNILAVGFVTALTVAFVYLQMRLKLGSWYYDTIILFPVGMIFSLLKDKIDALLKKHDCIYFSALGICFLLYSVFYLKRDTGIEMYSLWGIFFMLMILLVTMKVKAGNNILEFFGSHVFSIYILQRIPMLILSKSGFAESHKYLFVCLCFMCTVTLAVLFDYAMGKLDKLLFERKKVNKVN
ncbi:MAG: acyltransferase family protein [Acutalibacteraceae bacterium]